MRTINLLLTLFIACATCQPGFGGLFSRKRETDSKESNTRRIPLRAELPKEEQEAIQLCKYTPEKEDRDYDISKWSKEMAQYLREARQFFGDNNFRKGNDPFTSAEDHAYHHGLALDPKLWQWRLQACENEEQTLISEAKAAGQVANVLYSQGNREGYKASTERSAEALRMAKAIGALKPQLTQQYDAAVILWNKSMPCF